jgi:chromosome partitioning protein
MTEIIALMGRKGGITKTTLAVNLAAGCARAGLKTLIVDADGQGNASSSVRVQPHDAFYELIINDAEFADVVVEVPKEFHGEGPLYLLSASDLQRRVEAHEDTAQRIYDRFEELDGVFDVVIVDTSPGITSVHNGFYYRSSRVYLPTLCDFTSIKSLESTISYLTSARELAEQSGLNVAKIAGIVPNKFNGSEKVQHSNFGYLRGLYPNVHHIPVFDFVRDLTVWRQAIQFRLSIYNYAPADDYNARRQARVAASEIDPVLRSVLDLLPAVTA